MNATIGSSRRQWGAGIGAGIVLSLVYAASPLFTITLLGSGILLAAAGRGLPAEEKVWLRIALGGALALRFALIGAMLVGSMPLLNDLSVGGLRGDDAYYLARAIRARDIALGLTHAHYDYFVVTDNYGRTSYLHVLTALQFLFGPAPYGMRAVNALIFVTAAVVLFRAIRPAYGATASLSALVLLLLLPSQVVGSVSLVKEPSYFLVGALLFWSVVTVMRRAGVASMLPGMVIAAACAITLESLRRGALVLATAGVAIGLAMSLALSTRRRAAVAVVAATLAVIAAGAQPAVRARTLDAVTIAAKQHAGHVFTSGHAYKLLDDGFYAIPAARPAWAITLTDRQALRFLVRAAVSFVVTPLPWEMTSWSELAFFPEHLVWLLLLVFAVPGVIAGMQRDRHVTALVVGFIIPTAAAIALTNGNVGTLLRLRGLVTPYLVWLSTLGALAAADYLLARTRPQSGSEDNRWP